MMHTIPATHLILNAGSNSPNISSLNTRFRCINSFNIFIPDILIRIWVTLDKRNSDANAATLFSLKKTSLDQKKNLIKLIHSSFGGDPEYAHPSA